MTERRVQSQEEKTVEPRFIDVSRQNRVPDNRPTNLHCIPHSFHDTGPNVSVLVTKYKNYFL